MYFMFSLVNFFRFMNLFFFHCFCYVDLMHMQFPGYHSYFKKDFQMLLAVIKGEIQSPNCATTLPKILYIKNDH